MAEVSGVKMTPVDGGDSVEIPSGKTTIGRGTFLQVLVPCVCFCLIYKLIKYVKVCVLLFARGVQLAKNDFGLVFGSVLQKTAVFGSVSVLLN